jgi:3-methyladenine DNA glycosylase/8-oxoguanine DNA glycosylase
MAADASDHAIHVRAPFDLALTAAVARRLPTNMLYPMRNGELRFVLSLERVSYLIGVRQSGPERVTYRTLGAPLADVDVAVAEGSVRRLLGIDVDLAPLSAMMAAEPVMGPVYRRLAGMRPPRFLNLWETLVQVIPFQQVSLAAAMSAVNRLTAAFGARMRFEGEEYLGVPPVERMENLSGADLRACGISQAKARALLGCAEWITSGAIRENALTALSDEDAALRLRRLPGIGPWSAQLILLRGFGRLGMFPSGDSGAARGLRGLFKGARDPDGEAAAALARLGVWRGYLYFMLLARRYLDPATDEND